MDNARVCQQCGGVVEAGLRNPICARCLLAAARNPPSETLPPTLEWPASAEILTTRAPVSGEVSPRPDAGQRLPYFGDYELLEELGRGGMGIVYRARQTSLQRVVAVKTLLPALGAEEPALRRFHAEAGAAARLEHPNIVPIFEIGAHEGTPYFSMGYVHGESLAQRLRKNLIPAPEAARLILQAANAVQYAHEQGVVHRDLKPANILVDEAGDVRVTDFGLAKLLTQDLGLTGTGQILGTPGFMAPEQALGVHESIGPATDVYGLGAVLYALLTGRSPFQADSPVVALRLTVDSPVIPPRFLNPDVPRDLEAIVLRALAKRPEARFASAKDFADDVARFLHGQPVRSRSAGFFERLMRQKVAAAIPFTQVAAVVGAALVASSIFITIPHIHDGWDLSFRLVFHHHGICAAVLIAAALAVLFAARERYRWSLGVCVFLFYLGQHGAKEINHQLIPIDTPVIGPAHRTLWIGAYSLGFMMVCIGAFGGWLQQRRERSRPLPWNSDDLLALVGGICILVGLFAESNVSHLQFLRYLSAYQYHFGRWWGQAIIAIAGLAVWSVGTRRYGLLLASTLCLISATLWVFWREAAMWQMNFLMSFFSGQLGILVGCLVLLFLASVRLVRPLNEE